MREHLSETARHVLAGAQGEARALNQEFVGSEHLLLGIAGCGDCEAARLLAQSHVDSAKVRAELLRALPKGEQPPGVTGDLPLSPKVQRIIQNALVRAQALREQTVSTRLLLLSLLDEPGTVLRSAMRAAGADCDQLLGKLAERPGQAEA
jgi:ATP-dependent Clp protease ATP-binding subunit ClpC